MAYGMAVYNSRGKLMDLGAARPFCYLDSIDLTNFATYSANSLTKDYSSLCPAGSQLLYLVNGGFYLYGSSVATTVLSTSLNVSTNERIIYITKDQFRGEANVIHFRPTRLDVFAILPTVNSFSGYGLALYGAGSYPLMVNSTVGMFATYIADITLNGQLQLPVSSSSIVFFYMDRTEVGIDYNPANQTLYAYNSNGEAVSGIVMKIVAFDKRSPTMSAWGFVVYGQDNQAAFTSNETPMVVRDYVNTPGSGNNDVPLANWGNFPMIPAGCWGRRHANKNWYKSLSNMHGANIRASYGPFINGGDPNSGDGTTVEYHDKSLPVIWGSDYF